MKEKIISVILPVWKPKILELEKCIQSILNQTYKNLEILIIYTASETNNDEFYSFIKKFEDSRIRVINNEKIGLANALNKGIEHAVGELIARIDQDDFCDVERFEKQLEFKNKTNANIVGSWAYHIDAQGNILHKTEKPVTHSEIRKKIMLHCPMTHPAILMDKKMIEDIGAYDPEFESAEDYELFFRAMSKGYKFANTPEYLVYTRENTESMTRGKSWKKQRKYYIKAKNKAFFKYNFRSTLDIIFFIATPFSYFISPNIWLKIKKIIGWYK